MRIDRFEDVVAWQTAQQLALAIREVVKSGAASRDFVVRDQIWRASVSTMTNIAEGFGRRSSADFARFLDIARASAREVQSLLHLARSLQYVDEVQFRELYNLANKTAAIISSLMTSVQKQSQSTRTR